MDKLLARLSDQVGEGRAMALGRLGEAFREMFERMNAARDLAARSSGLHPTDFDCIGFLFRQQAPVSPKEIIAHAGISSGAGTALLDRLEKSGLIHRRPNPQDRRSVLIELDQAAAEEILQIHDAFTSSYIAATEDMTDAELERIARFFNVMGVLAEETIGGKAGALTECAPPG